MTPSARRCCGIWLGNPIIIVHSLFLDDVDTALVLFDPTNRQEPLSGRGLLAL